MRKVRIIYNTAVKNMNNTIKAMRIAGKSSKSIAEAIIKIRNGAKISSRALMHVDDVAKLEARNIAKYGDAIGPSLEQLLKEKGTYEAIIESSTHTSFWYNLLFLSF